MGYAQYVRAIAKHWWVAALALLIIMGAAAWLTLATQKQYATTVTFFVQTPSDQVSTAAEGDSFGQKRVNSYVGLATTDRLLTPVLADTKVSLTVGQLASEISASADLNTVLLTVTVTDPTPERSVKIATSISTKFVKLVNDVESTTAGGTSPVKLELVSGPTLDSVPVTPRPLLNYGIALVLGLLVGCGLAILREILDTTIRSPQDLERSSASAVIGVIAFDPSAKASPLILDSDTKSIRAEAFRQLRTNLEFVDVDNPAKTVVVTSSVPDEGKSSTATNLAVIFAEAGKNVLLVEADLRRPRVAEYLGLEGSVGLTNVLAGQVGIDEVLQPWGRGGLTVLASGSVPPNPSELLGSLAMVDLLAEMADKFDVVIIDSPPLLPVTDAAVLAARADGALMVVRYGSTKRTQVASALSSLRKVDAHVLGCVLNMAPYRGVDAYGYGYGYAYQDSVRPADSADKESESDASAHVALLTERPPRAFRPRHRQAGNDDRSDAVANDGVRLAAGKD